MNTGLLEAIKNRKLRKQIIIVTHNATIPILGDAQNIIFCHNQDGRIKVRSSVLEGKFGDQTALDLVAITTDGGKPAIKKRVKKI